MAALIVGYFAGSGVRYVLICPKGFCGRRVPKRLTASAKNIAIRPRQSKVVGSLTPQSLRAKEKALRLKAEMAFMAAGGARGGFAREWLSAFLEEARGVYTPTAASRN